MARWGAKWDEPVPVAEDRPVEKGPEMPWMAEEWGRGHVFFFCAPSERKAYAKALKFFKTPHFALRPIDRERTR